MAGALPLDDGALPLDGGALLLARALGGSSAIPSSVGTTPRLFEWDADTSDTDEDDEDQDGDSTFTVQELLAQDKKKCPRTAETPDVYKVATVLKSSVTTMPIDDNENFVKALGGSSPASFATRLSAPFEVNETPHRGGNDIYTLLQGRKAPPPLSSWRCTRAS